MIYMSLHLPTGCLACYFRKCYRTMGYNRLILNDLQNEVVEIARQIQNVTKCKFCNLARNNSANLFCGALIKKKFNSKGDVVFDIKRIETGHCLCKAKVSVKFNAIFNHFKTFKRQPHEVQTTAELFECV